MFLDPTGRRRRNVRYGAWVLGLVTVAMGVFVFTGLIIPPLLPDLPLRQTAGDSLGRIPRSVRPQIRQRISVKAERERLAERAKLFEQLKEHPAPPAQRLEQMGSRRLASGAAQRHRAPSDPLVVGFYVNWDDNSLTSLRLNANDLDWVIAEWGLVRTRGRDSLPLVIQVKDSALSVTKLAKEPTPAVLLMLTNATGDGFDDGAVARLIGRAANRRRAIKMIVDTVMARDLAGVTVDFEELPASLHPTLLAFLRQLKTALKGRLLTQAVPGDDPKWPLEAYAQVDDKIFLMDYDEHDPSDDPGPVASQRWFEQNLERALQRVPARKLIVGIGQYGYQWTDTAESATELTFQDVMQLARDNNIQPTMDRNALNPTFSWDDPDSVSSIVWYLDAPTAWNEVKYALRRGVAGVGVWRLGAEDPSLWSVLHRDGLTPSPLAMDSMRVPYDVTFIGTGEILRMVAEPTLGERTMTVDSVTGTITGEQVTRTPSTYVIRRYGRRKHAVALTFDDGPDGTWTPMILDTLQSRGVTGTFFVIGENAEVHRDILRRELAEGNEIGNHTYSHPNLALVGRRTTRLELSATERLLEAFLNRRTALWRPPYFGDAEPTTADELVPVSIGQELGYITVGLHIDPSDWQSPGTQEIINSTLAQLDRGNIVLLHDGGGDRSQTVAALGPLIDSIRARGYAFTTVTALAGVSPTVAMAPLPPGSAFRHFVELTSYTVLGRLELAMHAVFLIAMFLGAGRLAVILGLAARQRYARRHQASTTGTEAYHPPVTVIIPAYNEDRVVTRTVRTVLDQGYEGLEVLVVDDGSPDRTSEVVREQFGDDPRVRLFRKPNGGKASALNYGVEHAAGEIIVALDADTLFPAGAIAALVRPLADPRVGAVAGNAKVGNRINLVTRWQAVEYITSQNIDRRAFSLLNCITVVPGAIGAWRKGLIVESGGFSSQTLAEDQDLTMTILEKGWRIAYADQATAYTEAPDTMGGLAKQRFRWSFGTLQCAWKHGYALLRPRFGMFGFVGLPNIFIFQLLFPFISPVADLMFLWSLGKVYQNEVQHGPEYAWQTLEQVIFFYSVFLAVDWLAAVIALMMEPQEDRSLSWLILIQRFAYRQVMYWVVVKSVLAAIQGTARGWGKQERKGTVALNSSG
jgi:peptidoglycan/xylan/chitin deacetylase (PgdA/CDA1 family)/spore germination protein YaaH/glycosyltransferase involved in cell wall biosynthesis